MPGNDGSLKAREFLFYCEEQALAILDHRAPPHRKVMWTILQLYYADPLIHFELQPQPSRRIIEVGLHFEKDLATNDAWAAAIAVRAGEFLGELGPEWELEAWTASWRRLHRFFSYDRLTAALARDVADELARAIALLGPFVLQQSEGAEFVTAQEPALAR